MNNFIFENKTKVYFGRGCAKEYLTCLLKQYGNNVMLAYGGGSIKKNGVYTELMEYLKVAGKTVTEFSGIMSNPTYAKVQEGAKIVRENGGDLILPVNQKRKWLWPVSTLWRLSLKKWGCRQPSGKWELQIRSAFRQLRTVRT